MKRRKTSGFSLTEMLIVIGIILVVALIALPAFHVLTGSNSTESANNQLSAALGRARTEAMGLQEVRGVMFFRDVESKRVGVVLVREVPAPVTLPPFPTGPANLSAGPQQLPEVYLDLVPSRDTLLLPMNIGVQVVTDQGTGTPRDRYIGLNKLPVPGVDPKRDVDYGGVILFDGLGKLVSMNYALRMNMEDPDGTGPQTAKSTAMAQFLYNDPNLPAQTGPAQQAMFTNPTGKSQFGFVVYDEEGFKNAGYTDSDPVVSGGTMAGETAEEKWLDTEGEAKLVNRYNGTLLRSQ